MHTNIKHYVGLMDKQKDRKVTNLKFQNKARSCFKNEFILCDPAFGLIHHFQEKIYHLIQYFEISNFLCFISQNL